MYFLVMNSRDETNITGQSPHLILVSYANVPRQVCILIAQLRSLMALPVQNLKLAAAVAETAD